MNGEAKRIMRVVENDMNGEIKKTLTVMQSDLSALMQEFCALKTMNVWAERIGGAFKINIEVTADRIYDIGMTEV